MEPSEWLRPLGVGELLDVAIKVYRARFATLVKAVAVVMVPVITLNAVVQLSLLPDGTDGLADPESFAGPIGLGGTGTFPTADLTDAWTVLAGFLLVGLLSIVASQLATAASFKVVSGAYVGGGPRWRDSLRFALSRLGSLLWLSVVVMFFLVMLVLAAAIAAIASPSKPLLVLALVVAAAMVVYLFVAWSVAVPVLLLEDWRGRKALKRSRSLVARRWWPALAVLVLAYLLVAVVELGLSSVLAALVLTGTSEVATVAGQAVVTMISIVLTTPLLAAVITVLYFDLRVRKEGFDIELLVRRMGPPAASAAGPTGASVPRPGAHSEVAVPGRPVGSSADWPSPSMAPAGTSDEDSAGEQPFGSVPAYAPTFRRAGPLSPPADADLEATPLDPRPGDEPTEVVRVPVYDLGARRSGNIPTATGAGSHASLGHEPGAPMSSGGGYPAVSYRSTPSRGAQVKVSTVVVGVFIGMWLFVASVFVVALLLGSASLDSLRGTPTTTVLPSPSSTP
jgi:hypothetical protein